MANLSQMLEDFIKSPGKTLETLVPGAESVKKILSFDYDDKPADDKYYFIHRHWLKLLHDYYFKVEHVGQMEGLREVAGREKLIVISNHANTLEAALIGYYFYRENLGKIRSLVFKEAFRLPLIREIFKSGQCIPISVEAGKEALKEDHILLFPEGMDFIKHYLRRDYIVRFHRGFLRIAKEYLHETGEESVSILPVGHDGIDYTIKFWIINHPFLVRHFIGPYLKYPYFVLPKAPMVFPTNAVFNWGRPRRVTLEDLKDEKSIGRLSHQFRKDILGLKNRARKIREMDQEIPLELRQENGTQE
ncbi:MAG: lysophospholipid acyltransferase family protein [bacterium]|nr:lysophospholipid acyltransferase family protein [bacterium]